MVLCCFFIVCLCNFFSTSPRKIPFLQRPSTINFHFQFSGANNGQQSPASLLFTTYNDIRLANVYQQNSPPSIEVLVKDLSEGSALDFFYEKQLVCWTDQGLETIECMKLNNGTSMGTKYSVVSSGLDKPEGLAIDWYVERIWNRNTELLKI